MSKTYTTDWERFRNHLEDMHLFRHDFLRKEGILARLKPSEALVYLALLDYVNCNTADCFPGVETVSKGLPLTKRAVQYALKALESQGLIVKERRSWKSSIIRPVTDRDQIRLAFGISPPTGPSAQSK